MTRPIGFTGSRLAGSSGSTTTCVMTVTTSRFTPNRSRAFCSDCWIMYPIQPPVPATSTPTGSGGIRSRTASFRRRSSPICGPLPWTTATRHPSRASATSGSRLARVWANCS